MSKKIKLLTAIAIIFAGSSCSKNNSEITSPSKINNQHMQYVTLDSGLECVKHKAGYHGGMSCNWEKYNRAVDACLESNSKQSTFYDKDGNEVIFPPVKGVCDRINQ